MTEQQQHATGASLAREREQPSSRTRPKLDRSSVHGTVVTQEAAPKGQHSRTDSKREATTEVQAQATRREPIVEIHRELHGELHREPLLERHLPPGHVTCPSPIPGAVHARHLTLARHTIAVGDCEQRQCSGYHKCSGCSNRSQPQWQGSELAPVQNGPSAAARDRRAERSDRRGR